MLDQGAFKTAKQAAESCDGPWAGNMVRLLGVSRKIGQTCPIAAKRNGKYFAAQMDAQTHR